jgi:hypothetical protein
LEQRLSYLLEPTDEDHCAIKLESAINGALAFDSEVPSGDLIAHHVLTHHRPSHLHEPNGP